MGLGMRIGFGMLTGLTAIWVAWLLIGFDAGPLEPILSRWVALVVMYGAALACFARARAYREERLIALLLGVAIFVWTAADTYYRIVFWTLDVIPIPSIADPIYWLFYPTAYCAIALLLRARVRNISRGVWLDGAIGGLAVATVAAAVVFEAVLKSLHGAKPLEIATGLTYPLADMILLALVVAAIAISGWRLDRTWLWLGAGLATFAIADSLYLFQNANDTYKPGGLLDASWAIGAIMMAWAVWRPRGRTGLYATGRWRGIAMPIAFALVALAVLVSAAASSSLNMLAIALAGACLLAVLGRLVVTYGDNLAMLDESREEAATDSLTGLGSRRRLVADLDQMIGDARPEHPLVLALFDLNGFKHYNDTFGHLAGDALLTRLGRSLSAAVGEPASCYRMGGDEFCVLAELEPSAAEVLVMTAAAALSDAGEGFSVSCAYGSVAVPLEAVTASQALRTADLRMYAQKASGRTSAGRQSKDVLLRVLAERHPEMRDHPGHVARMAEATAGELAMPEEQVEQVRTAGELHDVGKVAIPDTIIAKQGPLGEHEWEFVRRHSAIGERIVAAAPALAAAGKLVRSVHERWDGTGYPDGLAGEEIPLGSRVVCVADAFHAMICDRPYRRAMSPELAKAELRNCSGSQFDPRVVEAFLRSALRAPEGELSGTSV
jgi:diguanylate cyclase (GGDEF)-like protein